MPLLAAARPGRRQRQPLRSRADAPAQARLAWRGQPFSRLRRRGEHRRAPPRGRFRRSGLAGATGQRRPARCAVGVSLGGNMLLKHLGEGRRQRAACAGGGGVRPAGFAAAGRMLERGLARQLYTRCMFCARLPASLATARRHPGLIDVRRAQTNTPGEFDDAVTRAAARLCRRRRLLRRASAKPWLPPDCPAHPGAQRPQRPVLLAIGAALAPTKPARGGDAGVPAEGGCRFC